MASSKTNYYMVKIAGEEQLVPVDEQAYKAIELALVQQSGLVRFNAAGSDEDNQQSYVVPIQHVQYLCTEETSNIIDLI
jgi:hypothetical protein